MTGATRTAGLRGKAPAVHLPLPDLARYAKGLIPAPPTAKALPAVKAWGMLGNDTHGDCVMADTAHSIMSTNVQVARHDKVPTASQVIAQYLKLTGGQDTGLVVADTLQDWHADGLYSDHDRIAGFAPVNLRNTIDQHQAIAFYGGLHIGVHLPKSAEQQFEAGQPWTVVPGSPDLGGHCIYIPGYTPTGLLGVTWGGVVEITYPFLSRYMDEAWAVVPQAFVEAGKGPALDLKSLEADLAALR